MVCYVEIVPTDTVKYEVDKASGILRLDRPQRFSNVVPCLYGFIPRSYCHDRVAARCVERTKLEDIVGDGDPLDVCVLTEKPITHGNILVEAVPIGGLRMIDARQADDKIIAVLAGDSAYGTWRDLADVPRPVIDRMRHYFLTYKQMPDAPARQVQIAEEYGRDEALEVVRRSFDDYRAAYGASE